MRHRTVREGRQGEVITFYSYKGGTGRSMAAANVAWILASNGRRVLLVDWDLEAPGLVQYFLPFIDRGYLNEARGVIDFVIDCQQIRFPLDQKAIRLRSSGHAAIFCDMLCR
jgi:hypothetical protein